MEYLILKINLVWFTHKFICQVPFFLVQKKYTINTNKTKHIHICNADGQYSWGIEYGMFVQFS